MPWIDKYICTACGICVDKCPVDTILMKDNAAEIDMDGCIRCAICHDICPLDAVKHDSDKVDDWLAEAVEIGKRNLEQSTKYLGDPNEGKYSLERTIKSYKRSEMIYRKAAEILNDIYDNLQ